MLNSIMYISLVRFIKGGVLKVDGAVMAPKKGKEVRKKMRELYHIQNEETKLSTELGEVLLHYVFSQVEPITWDGKEKTEGRWRYRIYRVKGIDGLVLEMVWIPAVGYSWCEKKILVLEFDEIMKVAE